MARPQLVGRKIVPGASLTTSGATISVTGLSGGLASSPADGDTIFACLAAHDNSDNDLTITDESDVPYALIGSELYANDSNDTNMRAGWKRVGSTADTNLKVGTSGNMNGYVVMISVWRGVHVNPLIDGAVDVVEGTNTGRPDPPAVTPTTADSNIIVFGAAGSTTSGFTSSDLTDFQTDAGDGSGDCVGGMGYHEWTSGSFDPAQFGGSTTSTFASNAAITFAIAPYDPDYVPPIEYVGSDVNAAYDGAFNSRTLTVAGSAAGDLLLISVVGQETGLPNTPTGCEVLASRLTTSPDFSGIVFWKYATGDDESVTVSRSAGYLCTSFVMQAFRGVPVGLSSLDFADTSGTNNPPALADFEQGDMAVVISQRTSSATAETAPPSGFGNLTTYTRTGSGGRACATAVASEQQTADGTVDPGDWTAAYTATGAEAYTIRLPVNAPTVEIDVGLASEADSGLARSGQLNGAVAISATAATAQALAAALFEPCAPAAESDRALALSPVLIGSLAAASEGIASIGLVPVLQTVPGLAAETSAPIGLGIALSLAPGEEADGATALAGLLVGSIASAEESDRALALSPVLIGSLTAASEGSTAVALVPVLKPAPGLASEANVAAGLGMALSLPPAETTDLATARGAMHVGPSALAQASEVALALSPVLVGSAAVASEAAASVGLSAAALGTIGLAAEASSALGSGIAMSLALAEEADRAVPRGEAQGGSTGRAEESDRAPALSPVLIGTLAAASEGSASIGLSPVLRSAPGPASETDVAAGLGMALSLAAAEETDGAVPRGHAQGGSTGRAEESDRALALSPVLIGSLAAASEGSGAIGRSALVLEAVASAAANDNALPLQGVLLGSTGAAIEAAIGLARPGRIERGVSACAENDAAVALLTGAARRGAFLAFF